MNDIFEDVQDLIISNNMKSDENEEDIVGCSRWKFDQEKVEKSSGKQKLRNAHKNEIEDISGEIQDGDQKLIAEGAIRIEQVSLNEYILETNSNTT